MPPRMNSTVCFAFVREAAIAGFRLIAVARVSKHPPEHPPVSGTNSCRVSGTIGNAPLAQTILRPGPTEIAGAFAAGFAGTAAWAPVRAAAGSVYPRTRPAFQIGLRT